MGAASRLRRFWQCIPLHRLQQGATLSLRSKVPLDVIVCSEWREDGLATFVDPLGTTHMKVDHSGTSMTSLGRSAPHVSLFIEEQGASSRPSPSDPIIRPSFSKQVDRVILDDGSIVPDCEIFCLPSEGRRRIEYHDGLAHVTDSSVLKEEERESDAVGTTTTVTLLVPEKVNLNCDLAKGGSILVKGKIEGDVEFVTAAGDIHVDKLRGHTVKLVQTGIGSIFVADLIEAIQAFVESHGRVRAKQINATRLEVVVQGDNTELAPELYDRDDDEGSLVDVSACFVSGSGGAKIHVSDAILLRRGVRIKSNHGPLRVETNNVHLPRETNQHTGLCFPVVELGGVNGECEIHMSDTVSTNGNDHGIDSCALHIDSLSPESASLVAADVGNILVTLDRKVEADLRLLSVPKSEHVVRSGHVLADEHDEELVENMLLNLSENAVATDSDRSQHQYVNVATRTFTAETSAFQNGSVQYMHGFVENRSAEPDSRFERKGQRQAGAVGKIRLDGAADQALAGFGRSKSTGEDDVERPLLAVVGTGDISVETVSWLGAIARRYGLEEDDRLLGRTAARRGRTFVPHVIHNE